MNFFIPLLLILLNISFSNDIYVNNVLDNNIIESLKQEKYYIDYNLDKYIDYSILNSNSYDIVREVNVGLFRDYYKNMVESDISKDKLVLVNKYHYLTPKYIPSDLEILSNDCSIGINNYLRHEAKEEFEKLCNDAKKEGINIYNLSAYRSYEKQLKIYNNKLKTSDINTVEKISARPGCSEHQTGLTVDINLLSKEFDKTNEYYWMINNSYKYGFIQRYPKDFEKITGYDYEPWHYRYVGQEVATKMHDENITFDEYYAYYIDYN